MKLSQKSSKKTLIITSAAALLIGCGVIGFLWLNTKESSNDSKVDNSKGSSIDDASKESPSSKETSPSKPATTHEQEKDITPAYEGESINSNQALSGVVSYKSVIGSELQIRTTINQMLSSGTCSLTLTRTSDQKVVSKTADIAQNPSSSTCQGFNIPTSELGNGKWDMSIMVTSGDRMGTLKDTVSI